MEIILNDEKCDLVKEYVPNNGALYKLAEFFGSFSDVTRAKIVCALAITEMCVGDLANLLDLNQTTCSHQLRHLKTTNIVETRRDGKLVFYSLKNRKISEVMLAGVDYLGF